MVLKKFFPLFVRTTKIRAMHTMCMNEPPKNYLHLYLKEFKRFKYTQYKGVKGLRNRKNEYEAREVEETGDIDVDNKNNIESLNLDDRDYDDVANMAMNVSRNFNVVQNVLIIQPYVKWGSKRNKETTPDQQLVEAEALIRSLPHWNVALSIKVPLESLDKKALFGSGKMEELKTLIQSQRQKKHEQPLTCIFVSKGSLTFIQKRILSNEFHLPIMDRYSVVIQILRLHATSAEARIQVAMAELPYIWAQAKDDNVSMSRKQGYSLNDTQRELLKLRERKLKTELESIRNHRKLLRNKRKQSNYPIVAVVGYTNAGKTSLIKSLTNQQKMQPRNQLFATLDVTAHAGMLPCNLEVIYMDTVGFMSDLPTGLIECFIATLEDALLADVIVHVQDLAHDCCEMQKQHVETTLKNLTQNLSINLRDLRVPPIINVANKIDLLPTPSNLQDNNINFVSAKKQIGLHELLIKIEEKVLVATERKHATIRVRNGGNEMAWLYKNSAVVDIRADAKNAEYLLMNVVISESAMARFRRILCE